MRNFLAGMVVAVAVASSSCSDPAEGLPEPTATEVGTPVGAAVSAMIGPAGGTVKTDDGRLSVKIPAGALSADTTITIQPITNTSHGGRGLAYELLPEGQTFSVPVELALTWTDEDIAGSAPEFLNWAVQNAEGLWELQDSKIDKEARTLTAATPHFSRWSAGVDLEITPSLNIMRTDTKKRFEVLMCSLRPLGRDASGESRFRFKCSPVSTGFAARALGKWSVNGIPGGDSTVGTVTGPELVDYTAPSRIPSPDTVSVSAQVTALDGTISTPIGVKVRIVANATSYGGRYQFTQRYGSDMTITGTVDLVWTPKRNDGDVVSYTATTGLVSAHIEVVDCDPVDDTLNITDSDFVLYTASNVAFARQYHFSGSTSATVNLSCHTPRRPVPRAVAVTIAGGVCNNPPPFATFTDEAKLSGSETCSWGMASWTFDALED